MSIDSTQSASPSGTPVDSAHSAVGQKLTHLRWTVIWQQALRDACGLGLMFLSLGACLVVLDYYLILPVVIRACGLALIVAAAATLAIKLARRRSRYVEGDVAADVENQFPQYGQRIRTTLDYTTPGRRTAPAFQPMVEALKSDTEQQTQFEEFTAVVRNGPLYAAAFALAVVVLFCLVSLFRTPELLISAGRTVLLPLDYSSLSVVPSDAPVSAGSDFRVQAEIGGRPLAEPRVLFRTVGSQDAWQSLALRAADAESDEPPVEAVGELHAVIKNLQRTLEFKVIAGGMSSGRHQVVVLQPLTLERSIARVDPPAYTGRQPETVEKIDLKVIEGSDVELEFTLSRAPSAARLISLGGGSANSLNTTSDPVDSTGNGSALEISGTMLKGGFYDMHKSQQFMISARAEDGVSFESERFRIRVQPDGRPAIRFVKPPEDLEVTPTTEVTLAVEADDDFGLSKLGVACKVGEGPMQTLWEQQFGGDLPAESSGRGILFLEDHEVTFQDAVTYYAFAEDNQPGKPRRTTTELRFFDIRPYKREYQILEEGGT